MRDFQRDFNKNFNKITDLVESVVSDVAEQVTSPTAKKVLNSALDLVKPHFISLGARISVLSTSQVELTLPRKARNLDEHGQILPGVQISAAVEAYRLLWKRNAPEGEFQVVIKNVQGRFLKFTKSDLRIRGELGDLAREARWAELSKSKQSRHQMTLHFFDEQNQICSEVEIESELYLKEMLEWK
ncbi:MAG: hypothetical protein ACAH59_07840 [Pseudobdellovibrionaceae bacterium]